MCATYTWELVRQGNTPLGLRVRQISQSKGLKSCGFSFMMQLFSLLGIGMTFLCLHTKEVRKALYCDRFASL